MKAPKEGDSSHTGTQLISNALCKGGGQAKGYEARPL